MSDHEQMTLAARAAGYVIRWDDEGCCFCRGEAFEWRPLHDDGQALRLAVRLGVSLNIHSDGCFASRYEAEPVVAERFVLDPGLAVRRAIFRLAVAIGSQMQEAA